MLGIAVCATYGIPSYLDGDRGEQLFVEASAGMSWLVWTGFLWLLTRMTGSDHPPTDDKALSRGRKVVGWLTLGLFVLLFMPVWLREQ
ncbi:MAG: hypothetical protein WBG86_20705 [Polyangiales bacterium]